MVQVTTGLHTGKKWEKKKSKINFLISLKEVTTWLHITLQSCIWLMAPWAYCVTASWTSVMQQYCSQACTFLALRLIVFNYVLLLFFFYSNSFLAPLSNKIYVWPLHHQCALITFRPAYAVRHSNQQSTAAFPIMTRFTLVSFWLVSNVDPFSHPVNNLPTDDTNIVIMFIFNKCNAVRQNRPFLMSAFRISGKILILTVMNEKYLFLLCLSMMQNFEILFFYYVWQWTASPQKKAANEWKNWGNLSWCTWFVQVNKSEDSSQTCALSFGGDLGGMWCSLMCELLPPWSSANQRWSLPLWYRAHFKGVRVKHLDILSVFAGACVSNYVVEINKIMCVNWFFPWDNYFIIEA